MRARLFIFALVLAGIVGCKKGSGASSSSTGVASGTTASPAASTAGTGGLQFVCDLRDAQMLYVNSSAVSWDLDISPDGQHAAITKRREAGARNIFHCEVDGVPGPPLTGVEKGVWSADSSTYAYTANHYRNVVYRGTVYGPYHRIIQLALSRNGAHWAAFDLQAIQIRGQDPPLSLLLDGRTVLFPPEPRPKADTLRFDPNVGSFIYQAGPDKDQRGNSLTPPWMTTSGQSIPPPPKLPPPAPPPLPAGVTVDVKFAGAAKKYGLRTVARKELLVKSRSLGQFDCIWGTTYHAKWQAGIVQPDNSICFFVADNQRLYRLWVKP